MILLSKKTRIIFRWEFIQKVKSRGFLFSVFFLPAIVIGFTLLPAYFISQDNQKPTTLGILDETGFAAPWLTAKWDHSGFQILDVFPANRAAAREWIEKNYADAVLIVDGTLFTERKAEIVAKESIGSEKIQSVERAVYRMLLEWRLKGKSFDDREIETMAAPVTITRSAVRNSEIEYGARYLMGVVLVMMLYFAISQSAGSFLRGMSEEKNSRIMEILISSARPLELMTGKVLGLGCVGLLQIGIWIGVGALFGRNSALLDLSGVLLAYFFVYFILGYFFFAGLYSLLGTMFSSEQDIQPIQAVVSLVGILPVALAVWVLQEPEATGVRVLSFVPFLTSTLMILRIVISEPPAWEIAATMIVQMAWVLFMLRVSAKVFHIGLLMHGKRNSIKEVWRWARA